MASHCAHCGTQGVDLKCCARCKVAVYCGADCQKAAWKGHKKTCAPPPTTSPPVSLREVKQKVTAAEAASDWREILKWEGRLDELLERQPDANRAAVLYLFQQAHQMGMPGRDHAEALVRLLGRRIQHLGKMERFRDQGEAMCACGDNLLFLDRGEEAREHYQRARKVGEAHGFYLVECQACQGLGEVAIKDGRHEEGVEMMRHALVAAPLSEEDQTLDVLQALIPVLLNQNDAQAIDEVRPLVARYRKAATAETRRLGLPCFADLDSLGVSARLHEVLGKPQEAVREVRALLDLLRGNSPLVQNMPGMCLQVLSGASTNLEILQPGLGEEDLIQSVEIELAKLRARSGSV